MTTCAIDRTELIFNLHEGHDHTRKPGIRCFCGTNCRYLVICCVVFFFLLLMNVKESVQQQFCRHRTAAVTGFQ